MCLSVQTNFVHDVGEVPGRRLGRHVGRILDRDSGSAGMNWRHPGPEAQAFESSLRNFVKVKRHHDTNLKAPRLRNGPKWCEISPWLQLEVDYSIWKALKAWAQGQRRPARTSSQYFIAIHGHDSFSNASGITDVVRPARHSLGRAGNCSPGRSRRKGANIFRPRSSRDNKSIQ